MQNYTSANTSINSRRVPAIFRKAEFARGTLNLDLGGGKYDTATVYLVGRLVRNVIIDPYNRSKEANDLAEKEVRENGGADSCTLSNVLNVIDAKEARIACLEGAKHRMKDGAVLWMTVYEGDRSGTGRVTKKDCWQNNKPLRDYYEEVYAVFGNAHILGGMIYAVK